MSVKKISDIASKLNWSADSNSIIIDSKNQNSSLIIDYFNDVSYTNINSEVTKLNEFRSILASGNKTKVKEFILDKLSGFIPYDDGYFALIAGAHDLSVSVLYDLENDKIFLRHPNNFSRLEKVIIDIDELISLLLQKEKLYDILS